MVEASAKWTGAERFLGVASSGHALVMDAGKDKVGSSPMELVLIGLCGCTASDVVSILTKKREPFASLDIQTREYMQDELLKIWQRERKTVIFVTHSIDEAIKLSDRVAILTPRPGRVEEIKVVEFPRPRDPTNPAMVRLAAEVKQWLRQQVFENASG